MTGASTQSVRGKNAVAVLRTVGLLSAALKAPGIVALIFVVPHADGEGIVSKQKVKWRTKANKASVTAIQNIGDERKKTLGPLGITTVGDLRRAMSSEEMEDKELLKGYLEKFDQQEKATATMLQSIPQYVRRVPSSRSTT